MAKYSFIDCNYYTKDNKDKDIFGISKEFKNIEDATSLKTGILDPDISIVEIKDVEKGS